MSSRAASAKALHILSAGLVLGLFLGCLGIFATLAWRAASPDQLRGQQAGAAKSQLACRWAAGKIVIDGKWDDVAWAKAETISEFRVPWQNRPARTGTKARLLWDDDNLYFAAELEDVDLYADVTEHNGMCWFNDVFELFFKPHEDQLAYYEFQVNAANTQLEMFLPSRGAGGYERFKKGGKLGTISAVQLRGSLNNWEDKDTGWTVEGRIPWSAFAKTGGRPQAGDRWRFTLCRYDYSTAFDRPELSCTAPLKAPDFHRYEDYGVLTFEGP